MRQAINNFGIKYSFKFCVRLQDWKFYVSEINDKGFWVCYAENPHFNHGQWEEYDPQRLENATAQCLTQKNLYEATPPIGWKWAD